MPTSQVQCLQVQRSLNYKMLQHCCINGHLHLCSVCRFLLGQRFQPWVTLLFLGCSSERPSPLAVLVGVSGSCSPKALGLPKVGNHWLKPISQQFFLAFLPLLVQESDHTGVISWEKEPHCVHQLSQAGTHGRPRGHRSKSFLSVQAYPFTAPNVRLLE